MEIINIEKMVGKHIFSVSAVVQDLNHKTIERVYGKALPRDKDSTLYRVKLKGDRRIYLIYEDEMY